MDWQELTKTHLNHLGKYFSCLKLAVQMSVTLSVIRSCVTMKFMKGHEEKAIAKIWERLALHYRYIWTLYGNY